MSVQYVSIPFITGEVENKMEVCSYMDIYKEYSDIMEDIQKLLKGSTVVYGNDMTNYVGDGMCIMDVERNPIVIVSKRIIPEAEILILLHEGIHAVQYKRRMLQDWGNDCTEWKGVYVPKPVWFGHNQLANNKEMAIRYLELPWEKDAWMITSVIGSRLLSRMREKYRGNLNILVEAGIQNFTGAPLKDGLAKIYGYRSTKDFIMEAESLFEEYKNK